jgi:hypothetical protein
MYQSVTTELDQDKTSVEPRKEVREECFLSPILFKLYSEYYKKEALERYGDFKIGQQIIAL